MTGAYAAPAAHGGPQPWGPLAGWGSRVGASLIDALVAMVPLVVYVVGIPFLVQGLPNQSFDTGTGTYHRSGPGNGAFIAVGVLLMVVGLLASFAVLLWNRVFRQGRTGQSIGKRALGIRLVEERTGQPPGAGMTFVRELAHVLDGFFYIGYLWPLWDEKRQTFADKVVGTVVTTPPKP